MAYQKLQAGRAAAVTPSDTADIPSVSTDPGAGKNNGCVLFVGGAGNLKVKTIGLQIGENLHEKISEDGLYSNEAEQFTIEEIKELI